MYKIYIEKQRQAVGVKIFSVFLFWEQFNLYDSLSKNIIVNCNKEIPWS